MQKIIQSVLIIFFASSMVLFLISLWNQNKNRDQQGPVITMTEKAVKISVKDDASAILNGVTAIDQKDGDVTESLVVESLSNFIEKGRRQATIAAFDQDNHVTKVTREVIYTDYHSPHFSLEEPLRFSINGHESLLENVTVSDVLDGDISGNMTINQNDNAIYTDLEPGYYTYTISVVNSAGDIAQLPVTIELYAPTQDSQCPRVVLSDYLIYIKRGTDLNPSDYIEGILLGGRSYSMDALPDDFSYTADDIHISNPVDSDTPGVSEIVYTMKNKDDEQSQIRLIVVVEE